MTILGIIGRTDNPLIHDGSAALIEDGKMEIWLLARNFVRILCFGGQKISMGSI